MADYYPLLSKAVSGLDPATPEARQAIYERARAALTRQMASIDPPVSPEIVDRELAALEAVVRRIEAEQGAVSEPPAQATPVPEKSGSTRPMVGPPKAGKNRRPLIAVAVSIGAVIVIAVATLAFLRRNEPPAIASRLSPLPQVSTPAQPPQKTNDRVAASPTETPARAPQAVQTPERAPPAAPSSTPAPEATAPQPAPTRTTPAPTTTAQAPIAVANRMVMVLEGKDDPKNVDARQGSVVWRTEMISGGQGQPLQLAIRATLDVPEARTRAEITIQRNRDPAFPASHTIQVQFSSIGTSELGAVRNLNLFELRQTENQAGYALAGQGIAVMENVFLIALAQIEPALSRNVEMMKSRPILYLEFVTTSGRRGAMIVEKGVSGQQAFDEAFRNWQ